MVKGSKDKKISAMKDLNTGSAGIVAIVLYLVGLIMTISLTSGFDLFKAILISEILAKFSMVLMSLRARYIGSSSPFVSIMKDKRKLAAAFLLMIIPVLLIGETTGDYAWCDCAFTLFLLAISIVVLVALQVMFLEQPMSLLDWHH